MRHPGSVRKRVDRVRVFMVLSLLYLSQAGIGVCKFALASRRGMPCGARAMLSLPTFTPPRGGRE